MLVMWWSSPLLLDTLYTFLLSTSSVQFVHSILLLFMSFPVCSLPFSSHTLLSLLFSSCPSLYFSFLTILTLSFLSILSPFFVSLPLFKVPPSLHTLTSPHFILCHLLPLLYFFLLFSSLHYISLSFLFLISFLSCPRCPFSLFFLFLFMTLPYFYFSSFLCPSLPFSTFAAYFFATLSLSFSFLAFIFLPCSPSSSFPSCPFYSLFLLGLISLSCLHFYFFPSWFFHSFPKAPPTYTLLSLWSQISSIITSFFPSFPSVAELIIFRSLYHFPLGLSIMMKVFYSYSWYPHKLSVVSVWIFRDGAFKRSLFWTILGSRTDIMARCTAMCSQFFVSQTGKAVYNFYQVIIMFIIFLQYLNLFICYLIYKI